MARWITGFSTMDFLSASWVVDCEPAALRPIKPASRSSVSSSLIATPCSCSVGLTRPCFCCTTCQASCGRCFPAPDRRGCRRLAHRPAPGHRRASPNCMHRTSSIATPESASTPAFSPSGRPVSLARGAAFVNIRATAALPIVRCSWATSVRVSARGRRLRAALWSRTRFGP